MKSFDCWDTLIARRSIVDIHNEENNLFLIAENVAKVSPEDIFVSDFYDGELLGKIMPEITGLGNQLFVTLDGKYTGSIWSKLKAHFNITQHIGDNRHSDFETPTNNGINSILSVLSPFTDIEKEINDVGLVGLARTMRETRLVTWHDSLRQLQLVQSQVNFPMLFIASILLHRTNPQRLLMVSRDCCLWQHAQRVVRDKLGGNYDIVYFKTSRVAIAGATKEYLDYVNGLLPGTIIDYAIGPNKSLLKLVNKTDYPETSIITIVNSQNDNRIRGFLNIEPRSVHPEFMNLDRCPMYLNENQFFNPANIDWGNIPEIKIMHETFMKACDITKNYDFTSDFNVDDFVLKEILQKSLFRATDYAHCFSFTAPFANAEHMHIMSYLDKNK